MKNTAETDNLMLNLKKPKSRKNCLSPKSNACSFLQETEIQNNDIFLKDIQDKMLKGKNNQEKICSECIWGKNY